MSGVRRLRAASPGALVELLEEGGATVAAPEHLAAALLARLGPAPDGRARRLDAFVVEHGEGRFSSPFRWSARATRRTLGTGALRRLADDTARDLRHAAREELAARCDRARRGLARRGSLDTWLAAQGPEARGLCVVEALTWSTGLAQLLDLEAHGDRVEVGIPDAWRAVPGSRTTLRGRRDAVATASGAVLRVRDGAPGACAVEGLLVDGLVAGLAGDAVPPRVVGAWPDAGILVAVELDDDAVCDAARLLTEMVTPPLDSVDRGVLVA